MCYARKFIHRKQKITINITLWRRYGFLKNANLFATKCQKCYNLVKLITKNMFGMGTKEIIIIAVVLILLFGIKKIPELAKGIVQAIKHLKSAFSDDDKEHHKAHSTTQPPKKE
jgi:sec-independent protein translocase protein TatA